MTDLVIAFYEEHDALPILSKYANNYRYNIKLYNKGVRTPDLKSFTTNKQTYNLKNIGQATHTYLKHVIDNYDNLADVTIFMMGSAFRDEKKARKAHWLLDNANKCSGFMSQHIWKSTEEDFNFELPFYDIFNYSTSGVNANTHRVRTAMIRSDITPLGDWIKNHLQFKLQDKRFFRTNKCTFAVHKNLILEKPVLFYKDLIKQLEHAERNLEVIHFFERAWICVFVKDVKDLNYYKKTLNHDVDKYGEIAYQ